MFLSSQNASFLLALMLAAALLALPSTAQASPLGLFPAHPDISSSSLSVTYTQATGNIHVEGWATSFDPYDGSTLVGISADHLNYFIDIWVDSLGVPRSGTTGTLSITGSLESGEGPNLLSGELYAFGFPDLGGDYLEFVFTNLEGDLASQYTSGAAGVILAGSGLPGTLFDEDFANDGMGYADTFDTSVPEPSTTLLLVAGLFLIAMYRRR